MTKIIYSKLRSLTARELINALIKDDFSLDRQSGSHRQYRHPDGRRVTVSLHHASDVFRPKTLKSMIEKLDRIYKINKPLYFLIIS